MVAGLYSAFLRSLVFYTFLNVIPTQKDDIINYKVLLVEDIHGLINDGQYFDDNFDLQVHLGNCQVKLILKCMFLLRISKSTKDGTVCLPSPLRVTVNELTIYTDFLSNPGSFLGKYEEIDKANDILCSTSLIDHKKIIYARNDLLVNNGLDSIHNGLLPSIFANCTVTIRIVIFMGRSHYISRCKIKRTKRPCAYYCNSLASFRCPLEGDLVFKLNPGPTDDQQIIRPHYSLLRSVSLSTRTRDLSNLITVERVPALAGLNTYLPNDQLRFCVMNAQSLNNKAGELTDFVCEYRPDIVALTETWFYETESASCTLCTPSGYNLLDHPRVNRRGGGTGVLFRNNLSVKKSDAGELRSFEYSEWDVLAGTQRIHLVIIYRIPYSVAHPVTTSVFLEEFSKFLESTVFCANHLLITGDFNIHMDVADDTDAVRLHELLESVGLQQHVTVPTHVSEHTLDLIITRQSDLLGISKPWAGYLFSDHMPVHCQFTISKPSLRKTQISFRKMKSISVNRLCEELLSSDLYTNVDTYDLNELVKCYNNTLKSALDRHAPVINKTITKRPTVPWFTNEVKSAKRDRRRAERKWRKTRLHSDFLVFKSRKNHATFVMKRARQKYYTGFIEENSHDQRKLFRSAKTLFAQENDLSFQGYGDSTVLANDIGNFFCAED